MNDNMTTYTGQKFDPFEPNREALRIEDIAHALSMMTRANGHFPEFFSVGQHCIQCAQEAIARNYVPEMVLACLLHDASEAYLADVSRPVKRHMTMYMQIEDQLQSLIYEVFLGYIPRGEEAELVQNIDDACLYYEFLHFMKEKVFDREPVMMSEPSYALMPMPKVERDFLKIYNKYREMAANGDKTAV
ncbi:MAG: phosphohydrolase [Clostridiales bacterium]|nr:phosphohydrolase [Clostridiales bacterium]